MQPQSSPKDSSSSNPSPATTPQTIIPGTQNDQLDQGQTIIVQHSGASGQQIHLVGAQQQPQQQQQPNVVQQQNNIVLPVSSSASPVQPPPVSVSQHQIIEVPGNSTTPTTNIVDANNGNNPASSLDISNASKITQTSTLSPKLHLTESQNIKISASQILDNTNNKTTNNDCSETKPSSISDSASNNNSSSVSNNSSSESQKGPNITVAANIANTFINISSNQSSGQQKVAGGPNQNVNVIAVSQQPLATQHFMKTLTINTSRGNIFVPNVIATNLAGAPQFTVHHHQYGLHPNSTGPAPNVTVNPNGNFATNSNAMIRPHAYQATQFRPFLASNQSNPNVIQSPILAASLQTINKIATNQSKSIGKVTIIQTQAPQTPDSSVDESGRSTPSTPTRAPTPQSAGAAAVDNQIRVLTPSEIMRTLPSLSTQDTTTLQQQQLQTTNSQINIPPNINNSSSNLLNNVKSQANSATVTDHSTMSSVNNVVCSSTVTTVSTTPPNNAQTINDKKITVRIDTKRKKIHVTLFFLQILFFFANFEFELIFKRRSIRFFVVYVYV